IVVSASRQVIKLDSPRCATRELADAYLRYVPLQRRPDVIHHARQSDRSRVRPDHAYRLQEFNVSAHGIAGYGLQVAERYRCSMSTNDLPYNLPKRALPEQAVEAVEVLSAERRIWVQWQQHVIRVALA